MADNIRAEILSFPISSVSATKIQLPEGMGTVKKILLTIQSPLHGYTKFAPNSTSPSKVFPQGYEYKFENGPYRGLDVLGWFQLDSGSDFLILECER